VIRKADEIREDLGSVNELFDEAAHRRLVRARASRSAGRSRPRVEARTAERDRCRRTIETATKGLQGRAWTSPAALAAEIDLDATSLRDTLESAMAIRGGRPQLDCADRRTHLQAPQSGLPGWTEVIDDVARAAPKTGRSRRRAATRIRRPPFLEADRGALRLQPAADIALMHLSHPMLQKRPERAHAPPLPRHGRRSLALDRAIGGVPAGVRRHRAAQRSRSWRSTTSARPFTTGCARVAYPVRARRSGPLAHRSALTGATRHADGFNEARHARARVSKTCEPALEAFLTQHSQRLTARSRENARRRDPKHAKREDERYRSRQGEISTLISENTLAKLEREITKLAPAQQGLLFDEAAAARRTIEIAEKQVRDRAESTTTRRCANSSSASASESSNTCSPRATRWRARPRSSPSDDRGAPSGSRGMSRRSDRLGPAASRRPAARPAAPAAHRRAYVPHRSPFYVENDFASHRGSAIIDGRAMSRSSSRSCWSAFAVSRPSTGPGRAAHRSARMDAGAPVTGEAIRRASSGAANHGAHAPRSSRRRDRASASAAVARPASQVGAVASRRPESLALLTNGRQWRLIFAGLDFDALVRVGRRPLVRRRALSPQVTALRTLLSEAPVDRPERRALSPLLQAILDSRKGQAELSAVLGERVREAVELLVQAHGSALKRDCADVDPAEIYRAAVRVVMRMVVDALRRVARSACRATTRSTTAPTD
jgi:hypothetical protein